MVIHYILCLFLDIPLIWAYQHLNMVIHCMLGLFLDIPLIWAYQHLNMVIHYILCLFLDIPLIWAYQHLNMVIHYILCFNFGYSLNMGISTLYTMFLLDIPLIWVYHLFIHGLNMTMSTHLYSLVVLKVSKLYYIKHNERYNILPVLYGHIMLYECFMVFFTTFCVKS